MMKKRTPLIFLFVLLCCLLTSCGSDNSADSADGASGATTQMLPLAESVCVRAGTEPDGDILLDSATLDGFFASDDYSDQMQYAFALVLTADGKKQFRTATRDLAKEQGQLTLWVGDTAVCSPTISAMLNTRYVIFSIATVSDEDSYQATVNLLQGNS